MGIPDELLLEIFEYEPTLELFDEIDDKIEAIYKLYGNGSGKSLFILYLLVGESMVDYDEMLTAVIDDSEIDILDKLGYTDDEKAILAAEHSNEELLSMLITSGIENHSKVYSIARKTIPLSDVTQILELMKGQTIRDIGSKSTHNLPKLIK